MVCDDNVILPSLHFGGCPRRVLEAVVRGEHHLAIGTAILSGLEGVLVEVCQRSPHRASTAGRDLEALGELALPAELPHRCRDPNDNEIPSIAAPGQAAALAIGDAHLLAFASYGRERIVTLADFEETDAPTADPRTP